MLSDGTREVVKFKNFLSSLSLATHCIYGMLLRLSSPRTVLFEKPGGVSGASPTKSYWRVISHGVISRGFQSFKTTFRNPTHSDECSQYFMSSDFPWFSYNVPTFEQALATSTSWSVKMSIFMFASKTANKTTLQCSGSIIEVPDGCTSFTGPEGRFKIKRWMGGSPFHVNVNVASENVCDGASERVNIQLTSDLSRNRGKIRGLDAAWELRPNMVRAVWATLAESGLPSLDFSATQPDSENMFTTTADRKSTSWVWSLLPKWCRHESHRASSSVGWNSSDSYDGVDCRSPNAACSDVLRSKANNTIKVRAGSMALFCRWFESRFPNKDLPVREDVVYEYFCELRSSQPSASRADTFVSTSNFSAEVFGHQGAADAAASIRVKGTALDMFLNKRPRRRAPEIHPIMIAALEIAIYGP